MLVEPVTAPLRTQFAISEGEMPLTSVLRRLVSGRELDYVSRLARIWSVVDPETYFRNACSLRLSVHAEMQLLNFYDEHPGRRPAFRSRSICTAAVAQTILIASATDRRRQSPPDSNVP